MISDGYTTKMNFSKGDYKGEAKKFPIKGLAADALKEWLSKSGIKSGHSSAQLADMEMWAMV